MNSKSGYTVILGASNNKYRYSNRAAERLLANGYDIFQIGKKQSEAYGQPIFTNWPKSSNSIHTITLYLNPQHQKPWFTSIVKSKPQRVIFNPGTENAELTALLKQNNISFEYDCTLVLLAMGQY